jgi:hypothetical protein
MSWSRSVPTSPQAPIPQGVGTIIISMLASAAGGRAGKLGQARLRITPETMMLDARLDRVLHDRHGTDARHALSTWAVLMWRGR